MSIIGDINTCTGAVGAGLSAVKVLCVYSSELSTASAVLDFL